jgi:hypothetical protein
MASRKSATPPLASEPDVLGRLYREVSASLELVGERESFCLTYLAAQTRRFRGGDGKPAGVTAYGQSSAGKTVSQDLALSFIRPEDVWSITDLSEKALTRKHTRDFKGRCLVIGEATVLQGANSRVAYYLRKLFDDGRLTYEVLEESEPTYERYQGKYETRQYTVGPGAWFSLFTSTTGQIHAENATRQVPVFVDDTDSQTRRVMLGIAAKHARRIPDADREPWHEFDSWLFTTGAVAFVPFIEDVAANIRIAGGPALRRAITSIKNLVGAHALLHQMSRPRDADGYVLATLADYEVVRSVLEPQLARESLSALPADMRSLLKAVEDLDSPGPYGDRNGVTQAKLQSALGVSQATISRRCVEALQAGLIENVGHGRTRRYSATVEPGDDERVLPRVVMSLAGDRVIEDRGFGEVEAA